MIKFPGDWDLRPLSPSYRPIVQLCYFIVFVVVENGKTVAVIPKVDPQLLV